MVWVQVEGIIHFSTGLGLRLPDDVACRLLKPEKIEIPLSIDLLHDFDYSFMLSTSE